MTEILHLELPWPPTVNHYWLQRGKTKFLSCKALQFRRHVQVIFYDSRHKGFDANARLGLSIMAYPPDKRKRDLDNLLKSLLDSLEYARVFHNDNQVDRLYIERQPEQLGKIIVGVSCL